MMAPLGMPDIPRPTGKLGLLGLSNEILDKIAECLSYADCLDPLIRVQQWPSNRYKSMAQFSYTCQRLAAVTRPHLYRKVVFCPKNGIDSDGLVLFLRTLIENPQHRRLTKDLECHFPLRPSMMGELDDLGNNRYNHLNHPAVCDYETCSRNTNEIARQIEYSWNKLSRPPKGPVPPPEDLTQLCGVGLFCDEEDSEELLDDYPGEYVMVMLLSMTKGLKRLALQLPLYSLVLDSVLAQRLNTVPQYPFLSTVFNPEVNSRLDAILPQELKTIKLLGELHHNHYDTFGAYPRHHLSITTLGAHCFLHVGTACQELIRAPKVTEIECGRDTIGWNLLHDGNPCIDTVRVTGAFRPFQTLVEVCNIFELKELSINTFYINSLLDKRDSHGSPRLNKALRQQATTLEILDLTGIEHPLHSTHSGKQNQAIPYLSCLPDLVHLRKAQIPLCFLYPVPLDDEDDATDDEDNATDDDDDEDDEDDATDGDDDATGDDDSDTDTLGGIEMYSPNLHEMIPRDLEELRLSVTYFGRGPRQEYYHSTVVAIAFKIIDFVRDFVQRFALECRQTHAKLRTFAIDVWQKYQCARVEEFGELRHIVEHDPGFCTAAERFRDAGVRFQLRFEVEDGHEIREAWYF
ncbi:hypothetical protein B0T22DRAFT_279195 [Podospora appendiculata]|uniref:Uncharacterized protein n=1 Tax=Podospora appendiculata TaxID=314037 RepID=A0AAE1C7Z7_9PEZI|nr:hypothetical protein B0T22DRAFT_279195 [Podospora appendiculata]